MLGWIRPRLLLVAAVAGSLAVVAVWPPIGLLGLLVGAPLVPFELATGSQSPVNFPILTVPVLVLLWLARLAWAGELGRLLRPPAPSLFAFLACAAASLLLANLGAWSFALPIYSQDWYALARTAPFRAQLGQLGLFALSACVFVLVSDQVRSARWLQVLTGAFLGLGGLFVASLLVPEVRALAQGMFQAGADGALFWVWLVAIGFAQAAFNKSLPGGVRLALAALVAATLYVAVIGNREWLSGWIPALVALAVVVSLGAPRLTVAVGLFVACFAAWKSPLFVAAVKGEGNEYSLMTRLAAWRIMARIVAANPLLGLGPANYYHDTPLIPILGWNVNFSSHNNYVDLLAQTGIAGLGCLGWYAVQLARRGWDLAKRAPAGFARAYAYGALAGLAGTAVSGLLGDWFLPFVYNVGVRGFRASLLGWFFLGGLIALDRLTPGATARGGADMPLVLRRHALLLVVVLAVTLRIGAAVWLGDAAQAISGAADQVSYDTLAQRLLSGHGFSFPKPWYPFTRADEPTAHWSYLYTFYLAGVYGLVGHHPLIARLLQALASGLGCVLIYGIGERLFDRRVAVAAALLTALYAYFIFFNAALMTQTFYILAVLAALSTAVDLARQPDRGRWLRLGLFLGLGTLLRQSLLLFAPLLYLWLLLAGAARSRWRDVLLSVGMLAVCIVPWTLYNYHVFGDFLLLNSNGGYFLYASNHPDQGTRFDPNFVAPLPEELRGLGEPALDRELFRTAIRFVADDPGRILTLTLGKVPHYFWVGPSERSSAISNLGRMLSFSLYLPVILWGLVVARGRWPATLPLFLYVGFDAILHLTSWAAPRYRLPSDAVMMVFAGAGLVDLLDRFRRLRPSRSDRA